MSTACPGRGSRWNAGKDLSWVPLRPELVVEIKYDQLEGRRLRHTGHFLRWRPDREPASCTYDQLEVPVQLRPGRGAVRGPLREPRDDWDRWDALLACRPGPARSAA